ncbi:hypothetical protein ACKKBF_B04745 [Auxenochlorella protothecoides x Auxenochlorella symbiontica]
MWVPACCGSRASRTTSEAAAVAPLTEAPAHQKAGLPVRGVSHPKTAPLASAHEEVIGNERSLGSLTAWQLLAEDVAAHPPSRGESGGPDRSLLPSPSSAHTAAELILGSPESGRGSTSHRLAAYELLEEVGSGAFGTAWRALRRGDGAAVCIKQLHTGSMGWRQQQATRDEVRVLRRLDHPNIVAYHECFWTGPTQHIVMEYCEGGDLEAFIRARQGELLDEDDIMLIFVQLCLALQHVHAQDILHRDIKPNNIFLSRGGIVKLGDFGLSREVAGGGGLARTMVGTPYYLSPEAVQDSAYGAKSDVWAAGCVLYELATLARPFQGQSVSAIAVKILRAQPAPLPSRYSPDLVALTAALLRRSPTARPSVAQVLELECVQRHMQRYRAALDALLGAVPAGAGPAARAGPPAAARGHDPAALGASTPRRARSARVAPAPPAPAPAPASPSRVALQARLPLLLAQMQVVLAGGAALLARPSEDSEAQRVRRRAALQDCMLELAAQAKGLADVGGGGPPAGPVGRGPVGVLAGVC